mmetsp:Transcript_39536/g.93658  ORF Transcript_39536/g.93658 Transcript_39536/m.93658 type:complete len:223 (-) Transcript_39536:2454-3122(-)
MKVATDASKESTAPTNVSATWRAWGEKRSGEAATRSSTRHATLCSTIDARRAARVAALGCSDWNCASADWNSSASFGRRSIPAAAASGPPSVAGLLRDLVTSPSSIMAPLWISRSSSRMPLAVRSAALSSSSSAISGIDDRNSSPGRSAGAKSALSGPGRFCESVCCCLNASTANWAAGLAAASAKEARPAASITAASSSRSTCWMKLPSGARSSRETCVAA